MNTDLETWLQNKFAQMGHALGRPTPLTSLRIGPPLAEWEANFFARGLSENLFRVDELGEVESDLLPANDSSSDRRSYRLFSAEPPRLLRENVCQLAAAARLIFERGWLPRHIFLDPGRPEHHSNADSFDLLVRSPEGRIFIWIEARRSGAELEKLIADLRACSRRGPHPHEECGFPQNHPRHEFCVANQPSCLWAVAPDGEISFEVTCTGATLELKQLPSLPPRSRFELS
ncbi:MAG TPA: hypothetical protein VH188_10630 [Chthoniobacterales bacterium]|nr:hypothetical protein [Chthoniobacterales bacterium]